MPVSRSRRCPYPHSPHLPTFSLLPPVAPLAACAAAWGVAFVDPSDPMDCGIALNITCDAAGMVDWMVLNGGGIAGPIPASIGALIGLTHLDLDNNALTGSIPPTISHLTRLLYLDLSYNQLSGSIPIAIDGLLSITQLNFRNNRLSGSIPAVIANLTTLNDLCALSLFSPTLPFPLVTSPPPNSLFQPSSFSLPSILPAASPLLMFLSPGFRVIEYS
ncbi:unnamed protein product [Closterium sp. Naga37s-1]|nr:unnamed protein product [Closterium sp. Naga37s-1]